MAIAKYAFFILTKYAARFSCLFKNLMVNYACICSIAYKVNGCRLANAKQNLMYLYVISGMPFNMAVYIKRA